MDPEKPFVIETDAIGSCLRQCAEDGKLHPIAYESRKLSDAQTRYPTHEKKLLAIKQALMGWHRYLDNGHPITIITDHESLKYMNTIQRPLMRLARWIDEFQGYSLEIRYRLGVKATVPDALSRRPDYLTAIAEQERPDLHSCISEPILNEAIIQSVNLAVVWILAAGIMSGIGNGVSTRTNYKPCHAIG